MNVADMDINSQFKTPILFLVFNRPEVTKKVFDRIREIKPKYLYVAADGPRSDRPDDLKKCEEVREVATAVDWECEVMTLFREENLGCGKAVSGAITWFFENIDEGIILEDDIYPHISFFKYCSVLLEKYRNDNRIMMISGHNGLDKWETPSSYFFSQLGAIWGWATWKRAWQLYDYEIKKWHKARKENIMLSVFRDLDRAEYRKMTLDNILERKMDTWDYQWSFTRLVNSGLSVVPTNNLICNLGFGNDATHTKLTNNMYIDQKYYPINFPLEHPDFIIADDFFDNKLFRESIGFRRKQNIISRLFSNGFNLR